MGRVSRFQAPTIPAVLSTQQYQRGLQKGVGDEATVSVQALQKETKNQEFTAMHPFLESTSQKHPRRYKLCISFTYVHTIPFTRQTFN